MKNKKGFTLIELLAVIVILAIIALIATPIILNMINEARRSGAKSSTLGFVDSIEYYAGFSETSQSGTGIQLSGYNVSLPTMTNDEVTCTKETSGWNNTCKSFMEAVETKNKGKSPDKAVVILNKNGKVKGNSKFLYNNYTCTYNGREITGCERGDKITSSSNNNEPAQPSVPDPVAFSTDSWATIAAHTDSPVYEVGQEKEVEIDMDNNGTPESYTVRIANIETPTVCGTEGYSQTACGFVIEFVDIVGTHIMNETYTNAGGWYLTNMRAYLNGEFYNKLPSDLKSVIIETNPVVSGSGSDGLSENANDKIYLLSAKEVGFNISKDNKNNETTDTRVLGYYGTSNYTRIKKDLNNSTIIWWLRTAKSNSVYVFYVVADNIGTSYYNADEAKGVAPAFRVGK